MKNVTLLAVKYATLLLIEKNKATTTLEVKKLLRDLGYFAEQAEISFFMEKAAQELPLIFITSSTTSSSNYRIYTLPPVPALYVGGDDDDDDVDDGISDTVVTLAADDDDDDQRGGVSQDLYDAANFRYTSRLGELVLLYDDPSTIQNLGGEVTRLSTGAGRSFYFTQPVRRDLARSAHASVLGMDYDNTRSSTVVL